MSQNYLLISHIAVHNANALSSAMTIGTPSLTAFLGFVHALQRKISSHWSGQFSKVGICVHKLKLLTYRGEGDDAFSIIGTSNPLDKNGQRPSFVEEARCDIEFSLLLRTEDFLPEGLSSFIHETIQTMKFAGGDIERVKKVQELFESETNPLIVELKRELMPGFWLISRSDLIKEEMSNGKEALQALLDNLSISVHIEKTNNEIKETYSKQTPGWLIPIAVGFQGLTSCGTALNQRDLTTPHRFAEPVITLGEFKMVHRVHSINETLWGYRYIPESNLYLCINEN